MTGDYTRVVDQRDLAIIVKAVAPLGSSEQGSLLSTERKNGLGIEKGEDSFPIPKELKFA